MTAPPLATVVHQIRNIDGWIGPLDVALFLAAGRHHEATGVQGDLLEIGAYRGRSAIVVGHLRRPDERVVVCDVFEDGVPDPETQAEWRIYYTDLAQAQFDANWATVHPQPPTVVRAPSAELRDHVPAGSLRFLHIDGSHVQREVSQDLELALELAVPGAVIVLDDIFRPGSPGVAAAAWPAIAAGKLQPAVLSRQKLYATVGDPEPLRLALATGLSDLHALRREEQIIWDHRVLLVEPDLERDPMTGKVPLDRRLAGVVRSARSRLRR